GGEDRRVPCEVEPWPPPPPIPPRHTLPARQPQGRPPTLAAPVSLSPYFPRVRKCALTLLQHAILTNLGDRHTPRHWARQSNLRGNVARITDRNMRPPSVGRAPPRMAVRSQPI